MNTPLKLSIALITASGVPALAQTKTLPVIVAYTDAAKTSIEHSATCLRAPCDFDAVLTRAIRNLNEEAARSGLNLAFQRARTIRVTTNAPNDVTACFNLRNMSDGAYQSIQASGSSFAGTLIALVGDFTGGGYSCQRVTKDVPGISTLPFGELETTGDLGFQNERLSDTFAHEIGHQLGAGHQAASTTPGTGSAKAYVDFTAGFKTAVSDPLQPGLYALERCFCFSNPAKTFKGVPTGTTEANNVGAMTAWARDLVGLPTTTIAPPTLTIQVVH